MVSIVGADATPLRAQSDHALEWAAVYFELPDGYHLLAVSVQVLSAIDRPGSHIDGDWLTERRDGYEIRIRPDLAGAEQEVWIISDSHQIGVTLTSPPRTHVELSMGAASDLVQRLAIRLADEPQD